MSFSESGMMDHTKMYGQSYAHFRYFSNVVEH